MRNRDAKGRVELLDADGRILKSRLYRLNSEIKKITENWLKLYPKHKTFYIHIIPNHDKYFN
jgi:hypothetical protein